MPSKDKKEKIIQTNNSSKKDTGSTEFQVTLLTEQIKALTEHLKTHKKDKSSKRGLLKKVSQRNKLLKYLKRKNPDNYQKLITKLNLRK